MATNKFLTLINGVYNLVTGISISTGVVDANKLVATDGTGKINSSILPSGIGADTQILVASENLAAGDFVNIFDDAGTRTARKADASNNRPAMGFVLASVTSAANATVYTAGVNNSLTAIVPGTRYYLSSTTAGTSTATAPTATNQIIQQLGYGISTTAIAFNADNVIFIA